MNKVQQIQSILGVIPDGKWGQVSQFVLDCAAGKYDASSFADPKDVEAFKACKRSGKTDEQCFRVGDNGIGFTGLNVATDAVLYCAVPRECWQQKYATKENAAGKPIRVTYNGKTVVGLLGDTMPSIKNLANTAGIDLNPAFAKAFGVIPPFILKNVSWEWV